MILDYLSNDIKRLIYKEIHTNCIVKLHLELFSLLKWNADRNYYYTNEDAVCFNMRKYEHGKWVLDDDENNEDIMTIIRNGKIFWYGVGPLAKNY